MFMRKHSAPVDYSRMCNQTVTVYHKESINAENVYTRKVYKRAFLDFRKTQTTDKTGSKEANAFLLVIPGSTQAVFVGDKVFDGEGPEIADRESWAAFIPARVQGLVVASYVDVKKWAGHIVHTEAGG